MIDSGILELWDPRVVAAVQQFDQGDLVERPPLFYAATPSRAVWATTRLLVDEVDEGEDLVVEVAVTERPPYGILTSQGCDIADVTSKPWVQIAPVFSVDPASESEQHLANVERDGVPYAVLLDPPELAGLWLADLRLEMPVEKSWLANRTPIAGFGNADRRRYFSRRLTGRLQRPALDDVVHERVVRPLRRFLDRAGTQLKQQLREAAAEFRLLDRALDDGTHECRVVVMGHKGSIDTAACEAVEVWWRKLVPSPEVGILSPRFCTADDLSSRDYIASILVDERFLEATPAVA
jgi:hypothetical protein